MDVDKDKCDRILQSIKKMRQDNAIVNVDVETEKLVIFSLSGDLFAFKGMYIKEILVPSEISYVPGSPDFLLGVINVRGDIESVVAIEGILDLPQAKSSARNRILIAEDQEVRSGIIVESIVDVLDVPRESIKPPLSTMGSPIVDFLVGEVEYRGQNVVVIDLQKLFRKFVEYDQ